MTCRSAPGVTVEPSVLLRNMNNVMKLQHQARHSRAVTKPLRVHTWAQTEHTLQVTESKQLAASGEGRWGRKVTLGQKEALLRGDAS